MRFFLWCSLFVVLSTGSLQADSGSQPDIMLILLDDSGWTDFGCYGSEIDTPNIDRLADQGMRFTDCHSAAPNCSPSRAGLLTGRTPSRVGVYSYLPSGHVMHLPDSEVTVAELLKQSGYRTGHFGKWHLSQLQHSQPQPSDHGFEHSLGTDNNASPSHLNPDNFIRNGREVGPTEGYSCQLVVDEAVRWLTEIKTAAPEQPTFSCVWFHEPHTPIASPPELVHKYQTGNPNLTVKQATYFANIENVDSAVGRLIDEIDKLEMTEKTFLFLTSDNGPLNRFSAAGLRGRKSHVWEGGHRVPGIFRWPGHIVPESVCEVPISGVDFLPTVCDIAGVSVPQDRVIDGTSLRPLLESRPKGFERQNPLYWFFYRMNPSLALRRDNWVMIADTDDFDRPKAHQLMPEDVDAIKTSRPVRFELFNLNDNLDQRIDVSDSNPKIFRNLKQTLLNFHAEVIADGPSWDIPEDYNRNAKKRVWTSD